MITAIPAATREDDPSPEALGLFRCNLDAFSWPLVLFRAFINVTANLLPHHENLFAARRTTGRLASRRLRRVHCARECNMKTMAQAYSIEGQIPQPKVSTNLGSVR